MKTEDYFRLIMEEIFKRDKSKIDKYFKKFKQEFKNVPIVIKSLDEIATNYDGIPLSLNDINHDVEILRNKFNNKSKYIINLFHRFIFNRIVIFVEEVKLQIEFAKLSLYEYDKEKLKEPISTKTIFLVIHHFSVHVANACKLYEKLNELTRLPFCDNSDVNTTLIKELRNHLEHFEERLEAWNYLHIGKPFIDMIIINSSTKGIKLENCLRVLEFDKDIFYLFGERYPIRELSNTIALIANKISNLEKLANIAIHAGPSSAG